MFQSLFIEHSQKPGSGRWVSFRNGLHKKKKWLCFVLLPCVRSSSSTVTSYAHADQCDFKLLAVLLAHHVALHWDTRRGSESKLLTTPFSERDARPSAELRRLEKGCISYACVWSGELLRNHKLTNTSLIASKHKNIPNPLLWSKIVSQVPQSKWWTALPVNNARYCSRQIITRSVQMLQILL